MTPEIVEDSLSLNLETRLRSGGTPLTKASMRSKASCAQFAKTLKFLVAHRGLAAERQLLKSLGRNRLMRLYEGEEATFGEFLEIARILRVPLSAFQIVTPGEFPELEIAFAELSYHALSLSEEERILLADEVKRLADFAEVDIESRSIN